MLSPTYNVYLHSGGDASDFSDGKDFPGVNGGLVDIRRFIEEKTGSQIAGEERNSDTAIPRNIITTTSGQKATVTLDRHGDPGWYALNRKR